MAGNRAIFDRAMEQCREASAQGRWEDALRAAVRALQEFPQDVEARTAAAVALFQTNRLDKALKPLAIYTRPIRTMRSISTTLPSVTAGRVIPRLLSRRTAY